VTSQTPEEIQAEIEQQREQLAGTLDALSAKLDVKTQAQAKVAEVKDRATTAEGRPRTELIAVGAIVVVVAVTVVWWRRR
jgi:cobalamin biosynthesis Mg chelatase CobN